jgi:hypothetical protein
MSDLILAEQLLLLFLDDEKGSDTATWGGDPGLAGALLRDRTAAALVERGVLGEERRKLLGLFPSARFPQADPEPERALRERLRAVLLSERQPTPEEAMLVALLIPYDLVKGLVPKDKRKEATRRAKDVAEGGAAAKAVDDTLKSIQAAVIASTTAAIAASAAASGSS